MDADSLVGARPKSLNDILRKHRDQPAAEQAAPEETPAVASDPELLDALPKASDDYLAHGRTGNKPQISLIFMLRDGSFDGFAYANLERIRMIPAGNAGGGNELLLRFAGSAVTEVRLKGRNLARLHAYLGQHRTPWVRELPPERDFQDRSAAVITGIAFKDI